MRALEEISDLEVVSAIRYLDPDRRGPEESNPALVSVIALMVAIVGALAYIWLYEPL